MTNNSYKSTIRSYITGFGVSIILTLAAYAIVTQHLFTNLIVLYSIIILAVIQLVVQLFFFLHLGQESKPRWHLVFFLSTIGIILIVVIGSIWIMNHLNYNMTPKEMNQYIQSQDGM
jgi:cytochrome o ubiquinol oxidase operon protein cyoD